MKNAQAIKRLEKMRMYKIYRAALGDRQADADATALDIAIEVIRERPKLLVMAMKSASMPPKKPLYDYSKTLLENIKAGAGLPPLKDGEKNV